LESLQHAKEAVVALVGEYAGTGEYRLAQVAVGIAQRIDEEKGAIEGLASGKNNSPKTDYQTSSKPRDPFPTQSKDLPFFYAEGDRLVMRGPSRNGTYYEQRLPKSHFDLITGKLELLQKRNTVVRNQDLLNRAEMPVHEPGIILKLLARKGVLVTIQKGVYSFANTENVKLSAQTVWDGLRRS
jgi:hypothetical protein